MAINIDDWLCALGMERYSDVFRENDVDVSILPSITAEDLKDMGISSVGHRRRILDAIAQLRTGQLPNQDKPAGEVHRTDAERIASQERRQLSVVFTDLVGSTQLSEQLDAEELSALLSGYKSIVTEVVEKFGGFISQYLGDGVLAYFGWPQADEHDVERAIRSGLAITEAMQSLSKQQGLEVKCRVGIATGNVVVGDLIRNTYIEEDQAVGRAPNLAARIQSMAAPGTLVISDETKRIVANKFEFFDLGGHTLKGFKGDIRLWRVDGTSDGLLDLTDAANQADLPIVNRVNEFARLKNTWQQTQQGHTRSVLVSGEPGIGKSRLVDEFVSQVQGAGGKILRFQCSPFHTNDALYPVLTHIWTRILADERLGKGDKTVALAEFFSSTSLDQNKSGPLIEELVSFRENSGGSAVKLDALGRKEITFQALIEVMEWYVSDRNVLMVFEDLHWMDPTTKELLGRVIETFKTQGAMLVFTCRPTFEAAWETHERLERIELSRLSNTEIGEIASQIYDAHPLQERVLELIEDRSDGIPMFAEELSKSFIESGVFDHNAGTVKPIDTTSVPTTLNDLLVARLDRHPESRRILQTAAAIGRDFSLEVLCAVIEETRSGLMVHLESLVSAQIIVPKPDADGMYSFRHALMRDAAYENMLRSVRVMVHARVASVLNANFRKATPSHVLGNHWALSGNHAAAARCYNQAADLARSRYANTEAKAYYQTALTHLEKVDLKQVSDPSTLPNRVDVLEHLGTVLTLVHDLNDAVASFRRAINNAGSDAQRIARLHRLAGNALQQNRSGSLAELTAAEHVLEDNNWQTDPALRGEWIDVQLNILNVHYWSGDGKAMSELADTLAAYVAHMTAEQRAEYFDQLVLRDLRTTRYDPGPETIQTAENYVSAANETSNLAIIASAKFILGFVNLHSHRLPQAAAAMQDGLEAARQSGHRKIELRCMTYLAFVYRRMNQASESLELSRNSIALAQELHMHEYVALATSNLAWEAWARGAFLEARTHAQTALEQFGKTGIAYPFEWSAILPLIAAADSDADLCKVPALCARMLDQSQQVLPAELQSRIHTLCEMSETEEPTRIRDGIAALLTAARDSDFH